MNSSAYISALSHTEASVDETVFLSGTRVLYREKAELIPIIDLENVFLPESLGRPYVTTIFEHVLHRQAAVELARSSIYRSVTGSPEKRTLTRQIYAFRNVLDWLSTRGVYRLSDADESSILAMLKDHSEFGWVGALQIEQRWDRVLCKLSADEILDGINFLKTGGKLKADTMKTLFWARRLGLGGYIPLTPDARARIEACCPDGLSERWISRKPDLPRPTTRLGAQQLAAALGEWCMLPQHVDSLRVRVKSRTVRRWQHIQVHPGRTANMSLETAVQTISHALFLVNQVGPQLVRVLKDTPRESRPERARLRVHAANKRIKGLTGKFIASWMPLKGKHSTRWISFDQAVCAVTGACAIVIAAFNGRRQREICDPTLGLRSSDLFTIDRQRGVYQTTFYVEKTHHERQTFFINRSTAAAIELLQNIKSLSFVPSPSRPTPSDSLFASCRRSARGSQSEVHFSFSSSAHRKRGLSPFYEVFSGAPTERVTPHMFRRFFALLYYHRYDNAELRALKQHLRHINVAMTRVYVTDPLTRPLAEQIQSRIGANANGSVLSQTKEASTYYTELQDELQQVERERLTSLVESIVRGERVAGAFARSVSALHRRMTRSVTIVSADSDTNALTNHYLDRGYRSIPMPHGMCHAPQMSRPLRASCESDDSLHHENASPTTCYACPYHSTNPEFVKNILEDIEEMRSLTRSSDVSPLERASLESQISNSDWIVRTLLEQLQPRPTIVEIADAAP